MPQTPSNETAQVPLEDKYLVLYDGVCGLCNRTVQFILRRDRQDRFRYAPLQGPFAHEILARHGIDAGDLNTIYLVYDVGKPTERLLSRSRAVLHILKVLGGFWRLVAGFGVLPTSVLDAIYRWVSRRRYRWFGQYDRCPIPRPDERRKFIDL